MNRSFLFTFLLLGSLASAENATTAQQVEARKNALEVAGAFGNAGFKLRDGHWASPIKKGEVKLIQVNLYAGNEYYFSAAFVGPAKKVALSIYDETGAPIAIDEPYEDGLKYAVGFSPDFSGSYYVKVSELDGEPADFCLVCSYK